MQSRSILLCVAALSFSSAGVAQSPKTFESWGTAELPIFQCPTKAYDANDPNLATLLATKPFFGFNGKLPINRRWWSCQQKGPFKLNGKDWFVQNVKNLKLAAGDCPFPNASPRAKSQCFVDNVRICSLSAKEGDIGPFGKAVGPNLCERLWKEDAIRIGVR